MKFKEALQIQRVTLNERRSVVLNGEELPLISGKGGMKRFLVDSDVHRSSWIPVQGCIQFDRQNETACWNPIDLKSVGLQYQPDSTSSGSDWSDARAAWNFQIHEQGESTRLKILIP